MVGKQRSLMAGLHVCAICGFTWLILAYLYCLKLWTHTHSVCQYYWLETCTISILIFKGLKNIFSLQDTPTKPHPVPLPLHTSHRHQHDPPHDIQLSLYVKSLPGESDSTVASKLGPIWNQPMKWSIAFEYTHYNTTEYIQVTLL